MISSFFQISYPLLDPFCSGICGFCMQPIRRMGNRVVAHDERHVIDRKCYEIWIAKHPNCPTCYKAVSNPSVAPFLFISSISIDPKWMSSLSSSIDSNDFVQLIELLHHSYHTIYKTFIIATTVAASRGNRKALDFLFEQCDGIIPRITLVNIAILVAIRHNQSALTLPLMRQMGPHFARDACSSWATLAAEMGNVHLLAFLIKEISLLPTLQVKILSNALRNNQLSIVELMLTHYRCPEPLWMEAFSYAIMRNSIPIMQILLKGIPPDREKVLSILFRHAVYDASQRGHREILFMLLQYDPLPMQRTDLMNVSFSALLDNKKLSIAAEMIGWLGDAFSESHLRDEWIGKVIEKNFPRLLPALFSRPDQLLSSTFPKALQTALLYRNTDLISYLRSIQKSFTN